MNCEFCGNIIRGEPQAVNLDGGLFRVCNSCARLGTPARLPRPIAAHGQRPNNPTGPSRSGPRNSARSGPSSAFSLEANEEFELRKDFSKVIKEARETLGLSQEELGRKISEKPSVISHLETGSLKPSDVLAKKLEHFLKVELFFPIDEETETQSQ